MSEEMKLITALTEALGFNVVINLDYKERKVSGTEAHQFISLHEIYPDKVWRLETEGTNNVFLKDSDGQYTMALINPETTYAVEAKS